MDCSDFNRFTPVGLETSLGELPEWKEFLPPHSMRPTWPVSDISTAVAEAMHLKLAAL
jgi:hypothetical protein